MNFEQARQKMVDNQIRPAGVTDHSVLQALLSTPREPFFAEKDHDLAYMDRDYSLGNAAADAPRGIMRPAALAKLIQLTRADTTDVALVIGAGTGYSCAVLCDLVSSVVGLESDPALLASASERLAEMQCDNCVLLEGPHAEGWEREAPYDVIFVEGSVDIIPQAWKDQLADGGRLIAVCGSGNSAEAMVFVKRDGVVGDVPQFNCSIPALPGFEKTPEFQL